MTSLTIVDDEPQQNPLERHLARIDGNFVRLEHAIVELRKKPAKQRHRSGRAARFDPDDARATPWLVGTTVLFALAATAAAFSGQIAMAPYTQMPSYLYFLVPLFIDLPVALLGYMAQVFRRRKQSAKLTWGALVLFTAISSVVNVVHVLSAAGIIAGAPLTVEDAVGASIMGLAPWIVLFSWEQLTRLLVRPTGEKREIDPPAPAPRRSPIRRSPK